MVCGHYNSFETQSLNIFLMKMYVQPYPGQYFCGSRIYCYGLAALHILQDGVTRPLHAQRSRLRSVTKYLFIRLFTYLINYSFNSVKKSKKGGIEEVCF